MNWNQRDWQQATKWITPKEGGKYTARELKEQFIKLLADGWEVIPIGEPCEGFDKKTGCPGHVKEAA